MFGISYESAVTLAILIGTLVLLASRKLRTDLVAVLVLIALLLSGVLSPERLFQSFGRPLIVIVAGIFILGDALRETGVAKLISSQILLRWGGESRHRLLLMVMGTASLLSMVLPSILVTSIMMPAVVRAGEERDVAPSLLLIPMATVSMLSNQLLLISSPINLIFSDLFAQYNGQELGLFTLTPYALISVAVGIGWYALVGQRLLREEMPEEAQEPSVEEVEESYDLQGSFYRLRVRSGSAWIGRQLRKIDLHRNTGLTVIAVQDAEGELHAATPERVLEQGDRLIVEMTDGDIAAVHQIANRYRLEPMGRIDLNELTFTPPRALHLAEFVVPYQSPFSGAKLADLDLHRRHGLQVLAVNRQGQSIQEKLPELDLETGDILLVQGYADQLDELSRKRELVLITDLSPKPGEIVTGKAKIAIAVLVLMVILVVTNLVSLALGLLLASVVLIFTGCLSVEDAYAGINPTILVILIGMLPLATALQATGSAELIANGISVVSDQIGLILAFALFYLASGLLCQIIPASAMAAIFTPVVVSLAQSQNVPPLQLLIPFIFAASAVYVTPIKTVSNLLIKGKGNYTFRDYLINNLPIFLIQGTLIFGVSMLWGGSLFGAAQSAGDTAAPSPSSTSTASP